MFGASDTLPFQAKEWQVGLNFRGLRSNDHYNGVDFQYIRKSTGNYVINTQHLSDLNATYTFTERFSASFSVPVVEASWSIPEPSQRPLGPRRVQNASGIGDIIVSGRYWLLDPARHPRGNIALGLGIKAPTGDDNVKDTYPLLNGTNPQVKAVDQSIQPGDGGWGFPFDIQMYKSLKHATFFGSGTYLINPRDTNNTDSIIVGLGFAGNPAFSGLLKNSVPDQYMVRAGAAFPTASGRYAISTAFRIEGLPRYDLIGDSHGWRRPGYQTSFEPGFIATFGRSTYSIYVPVHLNQERLTNPYTGMQGDATFPKFIILAGYSYRFPPRGAATPDRSLPGTPRPAPEPRPSSPGASAACALP